MAGTILKGQISKQQRCKQVKSLVHQETGKLGGTQCQRSMGYGFHSAISIAYLFGANRETNMGVPRQIIVRDGKQNFCLKIAKALIAVEAWRQAIRTDGGRA